MPGSAAQVVLTERQQAVLRKLSTAATVAKRLGQRATLLVLAFAGVTNEDIAGRVGLGRHPGLGGDRRGRRLDTAAADVRGA